MASPSLPDSLRGRTAPEQWVALPRELLARLSAFRSLAELKVVLYVLWHTYGYREYASMKAITLDEFEHGRKRKDGSRMDEGTGLSRAAIKLGLKQAKEDAFLYEVVDAHDQARIVRWYAVQLTSDGSVGGIDSSPLTQPYAEHESPNSSVSGIDSSPQRDRFQPSEGQMLAPGGIDSSPRSEKETLERNPKKEPLESVVDATPVQDVDALLQRQVAKHALQKLLAEQEQLSALLPSQRGWGAAQGRLRALARDITRLQDEAAVQAPAASPAEPAAAGEADPSEARRSPALRLPQLGNYPTEPAQDTRWQRLTKLQGELAQLKKSPSMQLLARQRIPRLEEAFKQMIASLAESV